MKSALLDPQVLQALLGLAAVVLSICGPAIAVYARIAATKTAAAAGVTLSEKQQAELERAARLAAGGIEEYVRNAQKHGLTLTSNEKLDQAAQLARGLAQDGLQAWADDHIKTAIEAHLPAMRAQLSVPPAAAAGQG